MIEIHCYLYQMHIQQINEIDELISRPSSSAPSFSPLKELQAKSMLTIKPENRKVLFATDDAIIVKTTRPWDVFALAFVAVTLALLPSFLPGEISLAQRISFAMQNFGTGALPAIVIYVILRYQQWTAYDMVRGQKACSSLREAARIAGTSQEWIAEEIALAGMAKTCLATPGACVPLRGERGEGRVSAGVGLSARGLQEIGAAILTNNEGEFYMVVGGEFLEIGPKSYSSVWYARQASAAEMVYRVVDLEEDKVIGEYGN